MGVTASLLPYPPSRRGSAYLLANLLWAYAVGGVIYHVPLSKEELGTRKGVLGT